MDAYCWDCVHPIKPTLNVGMYPADIWKPGETPEDALSRELVEELGIVPTAWTLSLHA